MTDKAKEWVTVKVPEHDRDKAKEYRPEGATFGDCLVAGAERLNEHLDSDTARFASEPTANITAEVTPELDEEKVDELIEELKSRLSEADPTGGPTMDYDDMKAAAKAGAKAAIEESVPR